MTILSGMRRFGVWAALVVALTGCSPRGGGDAPGPDVQTAPENDPEPEVVIDPKAQEKAIEEVRSVGGQITRDMAPAFAPVVSILFFRVDLKDEGLAKLKDLKGLRELEFNDVPISGKGLKHLAGLPRLRRLTLFNLPQFTEAGIAEVGKLTQLRALKLEVPVSGRSGKHLANLKDLGELYVSTDEVEPVLKELASLKRLRNLTFYSRNFTNKDFKLLAGFNELRELHLSGDITDEAIPELTAFRHLEKLDLTATKVTGVGLKVFTGLQELDLKYSPVTDEGLKEIATLSRLQKLNLTRARITDAGLGQLVTLRNLKELQLSGNFFGAPGPGLIRLQEALPECKVIPGF
jgi:hypothetical protein